MFSKRLYSITCERCHFRGAVSAGLGVEMGGKLHLLSAASGDADWRCPSCQRLHELLWVQTVGDQYPRSFVVSAVR